jgi:biotin operon repressor
MDQQPRYKDTGDSLLLKAFGYSPKLRIIDIFLTNPYFDFAKEELARELGMSKQTVYKNFKDLEELGVVKVSRKIGRAIMYRIDRSHPLVRTLNESVNEFSFLIGKRQQEQTVPASSVT